MFKKLKALWISLKDDPEYRMAGIFDSEEEIAKYTALFLFEDDNFMVKDYELPHATIRPLENGEYIYQIRVIHPRAFVIERILAPETFYGCYIDDYPALPLRIILSAKDANDARQKCLRIMAERTKGLEKNSTIFPNSG